jgi:MHS family alpha-ketoglutarate permease-like MFS transporter
MTLCGGQLCAIFVAVVLQFFLTEAELTAWGWRVPFVIGALLALGVYMFRRNLAETPSFENQAVDRPVSTAKLLWKEHRRESILVGMLSAGGGLAAYTYTSYMQKFLFNTVGFDKATATYIIAAALLWFTAMQPVFGALADKFGRKPMLLLFGIGGAIVAVPTFMTLETVTSPVYRSAAHHDSADAAKRVQREQCAGEGRAVPAHIRGLGVALPYAIGNAIFAGTLEIVALALKDAGIERVFYFYVAFVIAMAGVATLLLPETKERSLIVED